MVSFDRVLMLARKALTVARGVELNCEAMMCGLAEVVANCASQNRIAYVPKGCQEQKGVRESCYFVCAKQSASPLHPSIAQPQSSCFSLDFQVNLVRYKPEIQVSHQFLQ